MALLNLDTPTRRTPAIYLVVKGGKFVNRNPKKRDVAYNSVRGVLTDITTIPHTFSNGERKSMWYFTLYDVKEHQRYRITLPVCSGSAKGIIYSLYGEPKAVLDEEITIQAYATEEGYNRTAVYDKNGKLLEWANGSNYEPPVQTIVRDGVEWTDYNEQYRFLKRYADDILDTIYADTEDN